MNIRFLETFVWLAKLENFRLTAEKLHTTQAAVSSRIASLGAIQNFGGFIGGALAPILTGIIAQKWSFVPALLAAAAIAFAGAMAYLLLVRKPIPEQAANAASRPLPA